MTRRTDLIGLYQVKGPLREQWTERHGDQITTAVPAGRAHEFFDTQEATPDDRADFEADRQRWVAGGKQYYHVTQQGSREAYWIERLNGKHSAKYARRLRDAGYDL